MLVAILARPYSTSSTRLLHRSLQRHPEVMSGWYELPEAARVTHCMCCILHHSQNSLKRRSKNMGWLQPDILQVYSTRWSVETNRRANRTGTHDDLVRAAGGVRWIAMDVDLPDGQEDRSDSERAMKQWNDDLHTQNAVMVGQVLPMRRISRPSFQTVGFGTRVETPLLCVATYSLIDC